MANDRFWPYHLYLPLLAFVLLATLFELTSIDRTVADWLFRLEGGQWALRDNFWTKIVLHDWAKALVKLIALGVFALALGSYFIDPLKPYRRVLWFLAIAMPLSGLLVGLGKELSKVDCPWDLLVYGGEKPYVRLFEAFPGGFKPGKCFPGAHASVGYTFLALYFALRELKPERRFYGLAAGVLLGLIFGITQQLRGAHFVSHDIWTLAIAWFNSLFWYWLFFLRQPQAAEAGEPIEASPGN